MRNQENPGEGRRNQEQQKGTWINQEKQRWNQKKPGEILGENKSNYEKPWEKPWETKRNYEKPREKLRGTKCNQEKPWGKYNHEKPGCKI